MPGAEGAGTVLAVGTEVTGFAEGGHVAWADAPGSYAQQVIVSATSAFPVPEGIEDDTAAAAMLQGLTAPYLVTSTYAVKPGDTGLVHAAAGGIGLLLTQLVKARGGRVIGTVSTPEKEALARAAGAIATPEGFQWRCGELFQAISAGRVSIRVGDRYPLADAATAHSDLEARRTTGKLLLIP